MTRKLTSRVVLGLAAALHHDTGAAAVEFVLLAPLFLLIVAGLADFGAVLYIKFSLGAAVSSAVNYAMLNVSSVNASSGAALAVALATVTANAQGASWADASISVNGGPAATFVSGVVASSGTAASADACYCPTGTAAALSWGAAVTCASACPNGGYAGKFVVVQASKAYSPIFSGYGLVKSGTLSTSSIVQVQ